MVRVASLTTNPGLSRSGLTRSIGKAEAFVGAGASVAPVAPVVPRARGAFLTLTFGGTGPTQSAHRRDATHLSELEVILHRSRMFDGTALEDGIAPKRDCLDVATVELHRDTETAEPWRLAAKGTAQPPR